MFYMKCSSVADIFAAHGVLFLQRKTYIFLSLPRKKPLHNYITFYVSDETFVRENVNGKVGIPLS